jgi:hypothetical protein
LADDAFEQMGKTWDEFTGGDTELAAALKDTLGGDPTARGAKAGIFAKGKYKNMPEAEREELRNLARDEGMPERQVMKLFPSEEPQSGKTSWILTLVPQVDHMDNPEQYDLDTTVDARDAVRKRELSGNWSTSIWHLKGRERPHARIQDFVETNKSTKSRSLVDR